MFRGVKELTGKRTPRLSIIKDTNGTILTENEDVQRRWKEYCEALYKKDEQLITPPAEQTEYEDEPDILLSEVIAAVKKMKSGKAPGVDGVEAELIKESGEKGMQIIQKLCNRIWKTKKWPDEWKQSIFITIPKKGDITECKNNRTIALISHASKIMLYIIAARMKQHLDHELSNTQAGFRQGRGTRDQIANMRWIITKALEHKRKLFIIFIDYSKAFDCVDHKLLWTMMQEMGFPQHLIVLIKSLYTDQSAVVKTEGGCSEHFSIGKGVRQGCVLSPYLFNIYGEHIMRKVVQDHKEGFRVGGMIINELRYADDTTLMEQSIEGIKDIFLRVKEESERVGLYLNVSKTKMMTIGCEEEMNCNVIVDGKTVERVEAFNFLGSYITETGDSTKEIDRRLALGRTAVGNLQRIWRNRGIGKKTKTRLMKSLIFSIVLYAAETWTLRVRERKRVEAFELWAWRRMLGVNWMEHRTNISILQEMDNPRSLLSRVDQAQLRYFGHVARRDSDSIERMVMTGRVEGTRNRGRPKKTWFENIKTLTGCGLQASVHQATNRELWRCVVKNVTSRRLPAE